VFLENSSLPRTSTMCFACNTLGRAFYKARDAHCTHITDSDQVRLTRFLQVCHCKINSLWPTVLRDQVGKYNQRQKYSIKNFIFH